MSAIELVPPKVPTHEIDTLYETGLVRGKSTGWSSLDEWWTVRKKELTVVTGHPNHGKSCWLDNLLVGLASRERWRIGVFSAENIPVSRHIASLAEIYLGKPFSKGPTPRMSKTEVGAATSWLHEHFKFINPSLEERSIERILEVARWLVTLHGCDVIVLDPWNELDHTRPSNLREDEHISRALSRIRDFARGHDIHIFIVVHPAKMKRDDKGRVPVPTLFDAKGAQEWNSKADNGVCVWRDPTKPEDGTDIHVQKVRFREVGKAGGGCKLHYDMPSGRFIDPNHRPTIDDYMRRQQREPGDED
jgi:twinkle protein